MRRDKEKNRNYQKEWYEKNKPKALAKNQKRREELEKWLTEYKYQLTCSYCGFEGSKSTNSLSFHHINPEEKEFNIGFMINRGYSKTRILKEIAKCDVVCENCHRIIHYNDLKEWFYEYKRTLKCENCGNNDYRCLDFHHKIQSDKENTVSNMLADNKGKEEILKEIEKCIVLCANCHRELHGKD